MDSMERTFVFGSGLRFGLGFSLFDENKRS